MDFDDPKIESAWVEEQKDNILAYLKRQGLVHGEIWEKPDWFVAPYVSLWRIASIHNPKTTGGWAISGDLPTDYCSSKGINDARSVMRYFAKTWDDVSSFMARRKGNFTLTLSSGKRKIGLHWETCLVGVQKYYQPGQKMMSFGSNYS